MTPKELREKRAALATKIKELADKANNEKRDFNAEEKTNWEQVNKDYDQLTRSIELAERAEKVGADQAAKDDADNEGRAKAKKPALPGRGDVDAEQEREDEGRGQEDREAYDLDKDIKANEAPEARSEYFALALQGWMLRQAGHSDKVQRRHTEAAKRIGVDIRSRYLDINVRRKPLTPAEARALSSVDQSLGGSTIAPSFVNQFERAMLEFGGMRQVAQVIRTETGAPMPWPTANDTSNEGAIIGENTAGTDLDPATGAVTWNAYKYTSKIIKVPVELLDDSAFDLASEVGSMCGERIGRRQNRDFTVGDAAAKPKGVVTAATLGVTAASATAIVFDELFGLIHSIDPAYRNGSRFMFHDNILLGIRKLKDSQNRYLWQSDVKVGAPDTLLNYPYTVNQHMASAMTTGQKTVIFGQLSKYKIRDVRSLRLRRLVERYADSDQEGFVAFFRSDGNLLDAGVAPVKYLAQL